MHPRPTSRPNSAAWRRQPSRPTARNPNSTSRPAQAKHDGLADDDRRATSHTGGAALSDRQKRDLTHLANRGAKRILRCAISTNPQYPANPRCRLIRDIGDQQYRRIILRRNDFSRESFAERAVRRADRRPAFALPRRSPCESASPRRSPRDPAWPPRSPGDPAWPPRSPGESAPPPRSPRASAARARGQRSGLELPAPAAGGAAWVVHASFAAEAEDVLGLDHRHARGRGERKSDQPPPRLSFAEPRDGRVDEVHAGVDRASRTTRERCRSCGFRCRRRG